METITQVDMIQDLLELDTRFAAEFKANSETIEGFRDTMKKYENAKAKIREKYFGKVFAILFLPEFLFP